MLCRNSKNPVLTRSDIPDIEPYLVDATSVFNPGAVQFNGQYILMLRVQNRGRETFTMVAHSNDGVNFKVENKVVEFAGIETITETIYHCYDMRITPLDGTFYIMFAIDMESGCYLGLAQTDDFQSFRFLGKVSGEDNRNGVLFPQKFDGKYYRLDRPNITMLEGGINSGNTICVAESDNLLNWSTKGELFGGRFHYWDERIGAGPPPIKTRHGWLLIYHGIAEHFGAASIYQAGVALLDLNDPTKVLSRGKYNVLEPREIFELAGQVPNVVFPSGAIVGKYDADGFADDESNVNVYYGASDTHVGLATSTIKELVEDARQV
jgi:predicted GH43/DUF377 family glycosyl hydrolase